MHIHFIAPAPLPQHASRNWKPGIPSYKGFLPSPIARFCFFLRSVLMESHSASVCSLDTEVARSEVQSFAVRYE